MMNLISIRAPSPVIWSALALARVTLVVAAPSAEASAQRLCRVHERNSGFELVWSQQWNNTGNNNGIYA